MVVPLDAYHVALKGQAAAGRAISAWPQAQARGERPQAALAGQGLRQGPRHVRKLLRGQFRIHGQR